MTFVKIHDPSSFSFLLCKMGLITVPGLRDGVRIKEGKVSIGEFSAAAPERGAGQTAASFIIMKLPVF